jgi:hypothetical protein
VLQTANTDMIETTTRPEIRNPAKIKEYEYLQQVSPILLAHSAALRLNFSTAQMPSTSISNTICRYVVQAANIDMPETTTRPEIRNPTKVKENGYL